MLINLKCTETWRSYTAMVTHCHFYCLPGASGNFGDKLLWSPFNRLDLFSHLKTQAGHCLNTITTIGKPVKCVSSTALWRCTVNRSLFFSKMYVCCSLCFSAVLLSLSVSFLLSSFIVALGIHNNENACHVSKQSLAA